MWRRCRTTCSQNGGLFVCAMTSFATFVRPSFSLVKSDLSPPIVDGLISTEGEKTKPAWAPEGMESKAEREKQTRTDQLKNEKRKITPSKGMRRQTCNSVLKRQLLFPNTYLQKIEQKALHVTYFHGT